MMSYEVKARGFAKLVYNSGIPSAFERRGSKFSTI